MLSSVDFPLPIAPTIDTNSPRSTLSETSRSTGRMPVAPRACRGAAKDFAMRDTSMKAIGALHRPEPGFGQTHESIQGETNEPDGHDRQQDVGVDQAVVLLPQEAADSRCAGEHLAGDDHEQRDAEAQPIAGEDERQRGGGAD